MEEKDPMRECKEAKEQYETAAAGLRSIGEIFCRLGEGLQTRPVAVKLANTDLSRPVDVPDGYIINFNDLPKWEELKDLIREYDAKRGEFENTLHRLPPDERELFETSNGSPDRSRRVRVRQLRV